MFGANSNDSIPSDGSDRVPPVNRVRHYFDRRTELAREQFLREAVRMEIDLREQRETENGAGPARRYGEGPNGWSTARQALCAKDIRLHAWLTERLAVLHYERYGLWPKLRRCLFGNRMMGWLGCVLSGPGMGESDEGPR